MRPAAALAIVALAGCGGGEPKREDPQTRTRGRTPEPHREIRDLLDRRAAALEAGDVPAYAATGEGAQAKRDLRAARRARGLGLRSVELEPIEGYVGSRRAQLRVELRYRIRGVRGTFKSERDVEVRRSGAGWRVARQLGGREIPPWELGPFRRVRSRHYVILIPTPLPAEALIESLEAGYAQIRRAIKQPRPDPRYLVVVAADATQARALTEMIRGVATLAAIADAEVTEAGPAERVSRVISQRLLVVWPAFAEAPPEGRLRVVTHELTHAVLAEATSGRTPSWLLEGVALLVSGDRRVDQAADLVAAAQPRRVRRALTVAGLSEPDAIAGLGGDVQSAGYAYASAAAHYIAARFGEGRLFELYEAFNDEELAGEPGAQLVDAATREVLGRSLERFERDLRRWILTRALVSPLSP